MHGLKLSLAVTLITGPEPDPSADQAETVDPDEWAETVDPDEWADLDGRTDAVDAVPRPDGCTKDTDCKGDRICDSSRCVDPVATGVAPAPRPPPPRPMPVATYHPYTAGGAAMIVFGAVGIAAGSIWIVAYKAKAESLAENIDPLVWDSAALNKLSDHAASAPRVNAGSGILISSGGALLVTGIILAAIKRPMRVSIRPSGAGLTLRF